MTYEQVREKLVEFASGKKEVLRYSQTDQINRNKALQGKVADGFCSGACMEWLQLVLQGASGATAPDDVGAAVAYLAGVSSRKTKFYDDRKAGLSKADDDDMKATNETLAKLNAWVLAKQKAGLLTDADITLFENAVAEVKRRREEKRLKIQGFKETESLYQQFWADFAKFMDSKLKSNKYKNLTITLASSSKIYGPKGTEAVVAQVTDTRRLLAGYGVMIGLMPVKAADGHAVAIHHLGSGKYHFFDPNFGVYEYQLANLQKAIVFLFMEGYPTMGTKESSDSKLYQDTNGNIRGEYVIYRGPAKAAFAGAGSL